MKTGSTTAKKDSTENTALPTSADSKPSKKKTSSKKTAAKKTAAKKTVTKKATAGKDSVEQSASQPDSPIEMDDATTVAEETSSSTKVSKKKVPVSKSKKTAEPAIQNDADYDDGDDSGEPEVSSKSTVVPYERGNGHYMDNDQLAHFSKKLADWKQQLMEEVDRTVGHMKDDATNFPDPNDRATQEEEFSLELRTRDRERKLIKKINEAQKRIDDDEYGYCQTCGIEIGVNRLEARPTAELCIDCKTLEEIRERQTA